MTLFDDARSPSTLAQVREEAARCQACPLYAHATQTVFGAGPADAAVVLVGEQPGDQEDVQGRPFVGPAGKVLRELLDEVGLPAEECYLTNAVKHFKFEPRGKRRIHQRPNRAEATACHPWLEAELALVRPRSLSSGWSRRRRCSGRNVVLRDVRGRSLEWSGPGQLVVTAHPSSLLRTDDPDERERARHAVLDDLRLVLAVAGEV